MHDDVPFLRVVVEGDRLHEPAAMGRAVARPHVEVPRMETTRAMVPVTAALERDNHRAAVRAREADVLGFPGDGPRLRELKELQLRGRGSVRFSLVVPGLAGRVTDSPPFLLGRRLLPVPTSSGLVASLNPNHGRVCGFVSATVRRASPPPTGRCRSGRTGVGVVPRQRTIVRSICSKPPPELDSRPTISPRRTRG
jgi:hypothetical protein